MVLYKYKTKKFLNWSKLLLTVPYSTSILANNLGMEREQMTKTILDFLQTNPSDAAIEDFYINKVLPFDKRSISEILGN